MFIRLDVLLAIPSFHVPRPHPPIILRLIRVPYVISPRPSKKRTSLVEILSRTLTTLRGIPGVRNDDDGVRLLEFGT